MQRFGWVVGLGLLLAIGVAAQGPNPFGFQGKIERTPLGTGTVDGHPVKIEQVTVTLTASRRR
ncbi:MAG: hypothetical protein EPN33_07495 [Acidobacteria bacterium]|nr:MAG: hypothetical protein EPN33_07495 [Acidobacteriota bacterium]